MKMIHSYWAILVLALLIFTVANAFINAKKEFKDKDLRIALFTLIVSHIQLLIGLGWYFMSPAYKHLKEKDIPFKYRDHAWFTCFAPAVNPEIAVTVLVEHGMHGGSGAAPIAKAVLEKYFADRLQDPEQITPVIVPNRLEQDNPAPAIESTQ